MATIGELDLPDRLAPRIPRWGTELGVGLLCASSAIVLRALFDGLATGGAPFAFVYPAAILATLFARWRAGAITSVLTIAYGWYYTYPVRQSFHIDAPNGGVTVALIVIGAALTVGIADMFRRIARAASQERDREIADKTLLLAEFDHRMKNNFQIVASILEIQRRRAHGEAADALGVALHRVESIGRAHRHLYRGDGQQGVVQMRDYLVDLCDALAEALLPRGAVALHCTCDEAFMPRDRAVSIGQYRSGSSSTNSSPTPSSMRSRVGRAAPSPSPFAPLPPA